MIRPRLTSTPVPLVEILLLAVAVGLATPRFAAAATETPPSFSSADRTFVVLRQGDAEFTRRFVSAIRALGGQASVVLPSGAAIVYASDRVLADLRRDRWVVDSRRGKLDAAGMAALGPGNARAGRMWNRALEDHLFDFEMPPGFAPEPDARTVPVPLGAHTGTSPQNSVIDSQGSSALPLGAEYYDTSAYMAGSVAVGVWLLESTDAIYDWSPGEEDQSLAGVVAGMDRWAQKGGPGAFLTFFLDLHAAVPVSVAPITRPQGEDYVWVGEALSAAGWNGVNAYEAAFSYNNSIRNAFGTNWCFSIFIVDSDPGVNQGRFPTGGVAWAYYGGPWVYMSRYSTWPFNSIAYSGAIPMHETGHIFYATDEYDGGLQPNGYLNAYDNAGFPACIMNQNDSTVVCPETRNQLGWRDLDGDGIIEPLDTPPITSLVPYGAESTTNPVLQGTGAASVTTIPNLSPFSRYFPAHDMTVATIDRVEVRVDEGPWQPAVPLDGAFDGYEESFTWTTSPLPDGLRIVEVRAHTSAGTYTDPPARDSIWVLAQGTDRHPLVSAPPGVQVEETTPLDLTVTAYDLDGDSVEFLTADLTGLPAGHDGSFLAAPDRASGVFHWTPTFEDSGAYHVTFTASNALAGSTRTTVFVRNVDRSPSVAAPATIEATRNQPLDFSVSAQDPDGDPLQNLVADLSGLPELSDAFFEPGPGFSSGTFHWTPTSEDAGTFEVTFTCSNALTGGAHTRIHIANTDRPPVLTAPATVAGYENDHITFSISASDPDAGDAVPSLTAADLPPGASFNPGPGAGTGTFQWTPSYTQSGLYVVTFTASNSVSVSSTTTLLVVNLDPAPVVTAPSQVAGAEGAPMAIGATAADPDGDPILLFQATGLPQGAAFTFDLAAGTGTVAWTPDFDQAGSYQVTLSASSASRASPVSGAMLTGSTQVTIDVGNTDRAPVISTPSNVSVTEGMALDLSITAMDPDGETVASFTADLASLPPGDAAFTVTQQGTATFHWTPTFQDGRPEAYVVPLQASNALSSSGSLAIQVIDMNRPPVANPGGPYHGITGIPLAFHGDESSDPDGNALGYEWEFGDGARATGPSPLHAYSNPGLFAVTLTVTDDLLLQDSAATSAAIEDIVPARAFTTQANRVLRLVSGKPTWCARLEPIDGAFSITEVEVASIVMSYGGGQISTIQGKPPLAADTDGNGVDETGVCFSKANLRTLFAGLPPGRNMVEVALEGALATGGQFRAQLAFEVVAPSGTNAAVVSPNPLNPHGTITFITSKPGRVRVRVFDSGGRIVRSLLDEAFAPAGYHDLTIDGRSGNGERLGSGVYFFRIESPEGTAIGRFAIVR